MTQTIETQARIVREAIFSIVNHHETSLEDMTAMIGAAMNASDDVLAKLGRLLK